MIFYRFTAYRNSDEFSNLDLHMRSRSAPLRNRRDVRIEQQANLAEAKQSTETTVDVISLDGQRNRRDAPECVSNYNADRRLLVGCTQQQNTIEVKPQCNQEDEGMFGAERLIVSQQNNISTSISVYTCHGTWTENTTTFTVAIHAGSQHGVCITYHPLAGTAARLYIGDTCERPHILPTSDHHLVANLTVIGSYRLFSVAYDVRTCVAFSQFNTFVFFCALSLIQQANVRT